jgi:hypothetical protein
MSFFVASRCKSSFGLFVFACLIGLICSLFLPHALTAQVSTTGKIGADRWHLIPAVDFFNVTNAQTTVGEVTTVTPTSSIYLRPFLGINPFVTRVALRFTF